jgi:hypothetical protein
MGLHCKAVTEYTILLREGFQIDRFVPDLAECLLILTLLKLVLMEKFGKGERLFGFCPRGLDIENQKGSFFCLLCLY